MSAPPPGLQIGQHVGSYRIVREIGHGGMGLVYEALQESLGRRVALKVLRAEFSQQPDVAQRFFNEARAVNLIRHPGIVDISEFGQAADGSVFIVMELLEGMPLRTRSCSTR